MSPPRPKPKSPSEPAGRPETLGGWLAWAETRYAEEGLALGQVAADAHDEALYLLLSTLGLPLDSDEGVLERTLTRSEQAAVEKALGRRILERVPAAYLTGEAWLGGHKFRVDPRVIIPRSYFVEIIPRLGPVRGRIADVCTGSGCLAVLLALRYPEADVDAIELSKDALEVARANVRDHGLSKRVHLHQSDVFDAVPLARYGLIVSNPPYEPTAIVDGLPEEFQREPRMALDGGADGLDVIRKLLDQAAHRLESGGRVLIEVGGLREAVDREFSELKPRWLRTADGTDCVCLIEGFRLARGSGRKGRSLPEGLERPGTASSSRPAAARGGRSGSTSAGKSPRSRRS